MTTSGRESLFSARGRSGRFDDESAEYVATITVRISCRGHRERERALQVITERAVASAALVYDWHSARVVEASLVSVDLTREAADR